MTIRALDPDQQFVQLSTTAVAERLRAFQKAASFSILALSGGGAGGAFGAGALAGLTRADARPDFAVVTGVSAGALVAPYAFLGPTWDARLLEAFTSGAGEHLRQSRGLGVLFGSSLYSGTPLKRLVDTYLSDEMIQAVSREAANGRLLLVATTDVTTGQPVVWDLGSIARYGGPNARALFRDVLVASASVPGMFPPVIIHVRENGVTHDEAHVDGGATVSFFVPPEFAQLPLAVLDGTHSTAVYVIIDGPLDEAPRSTRLTARTILSRSIHAGFNHMVLTRLELTAATAQLHGSTLRYAAIPRSYPIFDSFDFSADTMRALFRYAYKCSEAGRLWTGFGRAGDDAATANSLPGTREDSCPAEDVSIVHFASR
jgi:predicted acylesterase/phospholipase RssA